MGRQSGCFDDIPSLSARHPPSRPEGQLNSWLPFGRHQSRRHLVSWPNGFQPMAQSAADILRTLRGVVVLGADGRR